ncbi:Fe-S cluster assembly sulfur transfer protein SufU [Actinoplanes teichomyceticus]|uniref:Nitrogen fixation NifU-like protein n=1 Tax=Actinoplanes teichomyceticus TaxID=1867 RepID=A0A561WJG1_ACTTI|nr:SUF system NifU family Fe-S cluster assembly protein [Actinoplanes teichomyceticus]TWG23994.1 nitrogen fixation NifU-like protein [Actinoplanes teichomyceticus]GIF12036.1 iron-sulfur cluster assembly scaffold protein NifU [Actinoplanes teichomyceticus]
MMLDALYQDIILDHYKNPHGRGLRDPYDGEAHHVNPTCGDEITVRVSADLSNVSYDGLGCSISQASASVLHELLQGRSRQEAAEIHHAFVELMQSRGQIEPDEELLGDGIAFAGVAKFPARVKCALLPWMAFKDAAVRAGVDVGASPEVKA